ncbi:hypothetical protein [Chitinimonas arctica]|uniref:hypothetical protein n=1 Tax=Chitinimonas arctica TaxID=2594795 RepID=UPI0015D29834|nr:hypothetical protein [Chitinimonas arctica]
MKSKQVPIDVATVLKPQPKATILREFERKARARFGEPTSATPAIPKKKLQFG